MKTYQNTKVIAGIKVVVQSAAPMQNGNLYSNLALKPEGMAPKYERVEISPDREVDIYYKPQYPESAMTLAEWEAFVKENVTEIADLIRSLLSDDEKPLKRI